MTEVFMNPIKGMKPQLDIKEAQQDKQKARG
jgi:hypothetical protein